jgi:hypothetical protein
LDYSSSAREVLGALKAVREADDVIWWHRAAVAIADLYPTSAIAYALYRPNVWDPALRRRLRTETPSAGGNGFTLEDLVEAAEAAAASEGSRIVSEVHLARGMAQYTNGLAELSIFADALVDATITRAGVARPVTARSPRILGAARTQLLETVVGTVSLDEVLDRDERGGTVERKRSIVNTHDGTLVQHADAAVALVNGNPEAPVFLIFGQEDDHTVVGEVNQDGKPITSDTVRKCQRRLDNQLQACMPPVIVKWETLDREGRSVWLACMLGRARGTAVRTPRGAWPYRSGEDTHFATMELVTSWLREPTAGAETFEPSDPAEPSSPGRQGSSARYLSALRRLRDAVDTFFASPPDIPNQIPGGRKLDDWRPVREPLLAHFQPVIAELVDLAVTANDEDLARLGRGLREVFALREPRGGTSWIANAPRLVCRLVADQIMAEAYVTERWSRIPLLGRPAFASYMGRIPWVVSPEYRHLDSFGNSAAVSTESSVAYAQEHNESLRSAGAAEDEVRAGLYAVGFGSALATMAWDERIGGVGNPAFAVLGDLVWRQLEVWEEEYAILEAFALLAGEEPDLFASKVPERTMVIIRAVQSSGIWLGIGDNGLAAANRIGDAGKHALEKRAGQA